MIYPRHQENHRTDRLAGCGPQGLEPTMGIGELDHRRGFRFNRGLSGDPGWALIRNWRRGQMLNEFGKLFEEHLFRHFDCIRKLRLQRFSRSNQWMTDFGTKTAG